MSRLFGSLTQIGIVVRDIEAAMQHWAEVCTVGPWFYADRLPVTAFSYRGERFDEIHISVALANSGDTQLELIQQRCDTPSMYRDFLAAGHEGMQHWSSWRGCTGCLHRSGSRQQKRRGCLGWRPRPLRSPELGKYRRTPPW